MLGLQVPNDALMQQINRASHRKLLFKSTFRGMLSLIPVTNLNLVNGNTF